jgi:two-component system, OmpR family, response regulator
MIVEDNRWQNLGWVEVPVKSLLVVDDDPAAIALIRRVFEADQTSVRVAKDGGQAQSAFVMHRPDFVIVEALIPGESGFEICERLKHTDDAIPVLMYTAIDMDDARDLAARVGADGYLCKPAAADELRRVVKELAEQVWRRHHLQEPRSGDQERIRFSCSCGKKFKVSATHRGKSMTCPHCGEPLTVPKHST